MESTLHSGEICLAWLSCALCVVGCGTRAPADLDPEQGIAPDPSESGFDSETDSESVEVDTRDRTDPDVDSDVDQSPSSDTGTDSDTGHSLETGPADEERTDTDTPDALGSDADVETDSATDTDTDTATETVTDSSLDLDAGLDPCGAGTNTLCDAGMDGGLLAAVDAYTGPKNVVLFIGDGMGFNHVAATSLFKTGNAGDLFFESFPVHGEMETRSANDSVTDSAAAATAMATGHKVDNYVVARLDNIDLPTLLDFYGALGKATGLVTTDMLTHATPAAFAAHADSRYDYAEIAWHYLNTGRPTVLMGGGGDGLSKATAEQAGYEVVTSRTELLALDTAGIPLVCGLFGDRQLPFTYDESHEDLPDLSEMATRAVDILSEDPDGYFLMVEGARIDHASHANDICRAIYEVWELESTIETLSMTAFSRDDTLFIVTADHETGGLFISGGQGAGQLPIGTWYTMDHTGINVPVYATGQWSERFDGVIDNTDIFSFLTTSTLPPE